MIEVEALKKQYGDLVAVDGISFAAHPGEILGLLGPNGAGKSTTIGCLSGLLTPSAGQVRVRGLDVRKGPAARRGLGVVPQELAIYDDLTASENLAFWGAAYGLRGPNLRARVQRVLDEIGLADRPREPAKRFSGGMQRRLNFGCGIVHEPKVLLLDEPTVGVDPQSREKLLDLVRAQARGGACVLYTTHHMQEAEALCDRLAIVDGGKIVAQGTLDELRSRLGERDVLRLSGAFDPQRVAAEFANRGDIELLLAESAQLHLALQDAPQKLAGIFELLNRCGATVQETTLTRPSLESVFITLTGRELRE